MANTNFAALTSNQLQAWSRDFWKVARNMSFINQFAGTGNNAMVQRITELTKSEKGTKATLTLLADMQEDGTVGDFTLEGAEEALRSFEINVEMDQLRFANRLSGRLADQKSVVNFREQSRDALAYAMADRIDQLAFLTLAGMPYTLKNGGGLRAVNSSGQNLGDLEFASAVSSPTNKRYVRADKDTGIHEVSDTGLSNGFEESDSGSAIVEADDTMAYRTIVELKAFAKENYIRGIRGAGNEEVYHMFVHPRQMADLKLDTDFLTAVRNAGTRGPSNPFFTGHNGLMVDGVMVHEFRHVPTSLGLADQNMHGLATGTPNIGAALFCGAQALAMADIGLPEVVEETFDYGNQHGISIGKIFGFKKPVYQSDHHGSVQDFGVIRCDSII
tara:strand:+ start:250 stop:1413 length:1164 start_codon:yes stop_codon:yes gene_type:complete